MNYIKRLEKENRDMKKMLIELRNYCNSPKYYWPDEGVNKHDILNRINQLSTFNDVDLHDYKEI